MIKAKISFLIKLERDGGREGKEKKKRFARWKEKIAKEIIQFRF